MSQELSGSLEAQNNTELDKISRVLLVPLSPQIFQKAAKRSANTGTNGSALLLLSCAQTLSGSLAEPRDPRRLDVARAKV